MVAPGYAARPKQDLRALLLAGAIAAMIAPQVALAQEGPTQTSPTDQHLPAASAVAALDDVAMMTLQLDARIQDTSLSMSAISGEALQHLGASFFTDFNRPAQSSGYTVRLGFDGRHTVHDLRETQDGADRGRVYRPHSSGFVNAISTSPRSYGLNVTHRL